MCLKALTPLVSKAIAYFDLAYLRAMNLTENGLILVVESNFVTEYFLENTNHTEVESFEIILRGSQEEKRPLDRLARKIRPRRHLRRNTSSSTARSACSEILHENLRIEESLSTFPRYQEPSFIPFWRKKDKGKRRSLQGKTVPKPLLLQYGDRLGQY